MNESTDGFHSLNCTDGTFFPVWLPLEGVSTGQIIGRGIVYIISMAYLFVGIAYLADFFMATIEMITSSKKEVTIRDDKGQEETIVVRVWNQTVANLTLIALGCAAPEVLLSCIEIVKNNFEVEELGPSETVASASFNLFAIIGVCIYVIPRNESRKIKYFSVFVITAIWSLFAYVWLLLITNYISPGVIEIWEAVVTLCFFPLTVISAFLADKMSVMSSKDKTYRIHHGIIVETMQSEDSVAEIQSRKFLKQFSIETRNQDIQKFEDHRRELIVTMKNLRRRDPTMNANQLELMAVSELLDNRTNESNAFFHIKASKKLTGLSSLRIRQESKRTDIDFRHYHHQNRSNLDSAPNTPSRSNDRSITEVFFSPGHYTVDEKVGMFTATVVRRNGDLNRQVFVDYATEDADAVAGKDYGEVRGTLCFQPGQTQKTIEIPIIDDLVYEGDQHFYIRLFNLRFGQVHEREAQKGLINPDAYLIPSVENTDHDLNQGFLKTTNETEKKPLKKISLTDVERKQITRNSEPHAIVVTVSNEVTADDTRTSASKTIPKKKVSFTTVTDSNEEISHENTQPISYSNGQVSLNKENQNSESTSVTSAPTTPTKKISLSGFNDFFHGIQSISTYLSTQLIPHTNNELSASSSTTIADHNTEVVSCLLRLACPAVATVMILDDDHHGIFTLSKREINVSETSGTVSVQILRTGGNRGRVALPYQTEEGTAEADKDFLSCHGELIFEDGEIEKLVEIPIVANRHHDISIVFFLSIGEPKVFTDTEIKSNSIYSISHQLEKEDHQSRIAAARPELGKINKITIRICKSVHFKNLVHKIVKMTHNQFINGRTPWKQQFVDAIHPEQNEDTDEENGKGKPISWIDYTKHYITLPWRLLFSFIPPAGLFGGYLSFLLCIAIIGILVTLLGDLAYGLGCTVGLKTRVTSLALVSIGTNVPDLLASRVFAIRDATADASITNVLGANIINVYLGVGLAWTMASIHHANKGDDLLIDPGTLYFMVILYISFALVALLALMLRRRYADGELGGPNKIKIPCTIAFISLWFTFVLVNAFQAYGYF